MNRVMYGLFLLPMSLCLFHCGFGTGGNDPYVPIPERARERGYFISGTTITFVYDESTLGFGTIPDEVYVAGSFNTWGPGDLTGSST